LITKAEASAPVRQRLRNLQTQLARAGTDKDDSDLT
jgi:hypothetical protein